MYGSEIWGDINFHKLNTQGDNYFKKLCGDLAVENAHLSFCKFILGVSKKATILQLWVNWADIYSIFEGFIKYV